jgi:two-component system, NtrC family, nitrogen regulation sensor histidine kinase NtrY
MLEDESGQPVDLHTLDAEDMDDLRQSLRTIASRSQGLVSFVRSYKSLTQTTRLATSDVSLADLVQRVDSLMRPRLRQEGIGLVCVAAPALPRLRIDLEMIEQVLINLILNAMDALRQHPNPQISLRCYVTDEGVTEVEVADNGVGMDADLMEQAFVPFFTTKAAGSGVGLSLSRQIMRMHKGTISLYSQPGKGTRVVLRF